jgi:uncharacterized repeat protein (TIGR02543 family)
MVAQASTTAANLSANRYERPGYVFNGWNTAANGTGTAYAAGANFSFATDLTLYAQWQVAPTQAPTQAATPTSSASPAAVLATTGVSGFGVSLGLSASAVLIAVGLLAIGIKRQKKLRVEKFIR